MKDILKGILVVLTILALGAISLQVKAGTVDELRELLDNKAVVYVGTCWFRKNGKLTFKRAEMQVERECAVGMEMPNTTIHYILLLGKDGATELLSFNEKTKEQKTLWRKGVGV